jgi:hypothetical protein
MRQQVQLIWNEPAFSDHVDLLCAFSISSSTGKDDPERNHWSEVKLSNLLPWAAASGLSLTEGRMSLLNTNNNFAVEQRGRSEYVLAKMQFRTKVSEFIFT